MSSRARVLVLSAGVGLSGLLYDDGTFALQLNSVAGYGEFTGRRARAGDQLTYDFDEAQWRASGALSGDEMFVTYDATMELHEREVPADDFMSGKYLRATAP